MNKLEALIAMCEGKYVEHDGHICRINEHCFIETYSRGKWEEDEWKRFGDWTFVGWQIADKPIDGHDWQWAMEQCDNGVKVRWYDWGEKDYLVHDKSSDNYCIIYGSTCLMKKKYFTKKGWVLA